MFYDPKFRRKMNKLTIYIAKHRHSTMMSSASLPCSNCTKKIKELGIKKIVYVDKSGQIQKCLSHNYFNNYICPGYKELARRNSSCTFIGRTGLFKYIDMIPAVQMHLKLADKFLKKLKIK